MPSKNLRNQISQPVSKPANIYECQLDDHAHEYCIGWPRQFIVNRLSNCSPMSMAYLIRFSPSLWVNYIRGHQSQYRVSGHLPLPILLLQSTVNFLVHNAGHNVCRKNQSQTKATQSINTPHLLFIYPTTNGAGVPRTTHSRVYWVRLEDASQQHGPCSQF